MVERKCDILPKTKLPQINTNYFYRKLIIIFCHLAYGLDVNIKIVNIIFKSDMLMQSCKSFLVVEHLITVRIITYISYQKISNIWSWPSNHWNSSNQQASFLDLVISFTNYSKIIRNYSCILSSTVSVPSTKTLHFKF